MFRIGPISTPNIICETMVLIMTINLEVKTRLIGLGLVIVIGKGLRFFQ
jgi:hypothetical protein